MMNFYWNFHNCWCGVFNINLFIHPLLSVDLVTILTYLLNVILYHYPQSWGKIILWGLWRSKTKVKTVRCQGHALLNLTFFLKIFIAPFLIYISCTLRIDCIWKKKIEIVKTCPLYWCVLFASCIFFLFYQVISVDFRDVLPLCAKALPFSPK